MSNEHLFSQHETRQLMLKETQEEFLWLMHEGNVKMATRIAIILIQLEDNN